MSEPVVFTLVIERVDIETLTYEATSNGKLMARGCRSECLAYVQGYIKALQDVGNILFDKPDIRNGIQTYRATWYGALM